MKHRTHFFSHTSLAMNIDWKMSKLLRFTSLETRCFLKATLNAKSLPLLLWSNVKYSTSLNKNKTYAHIHNLFHTYVHTHKPYTKPACVCTFKSNFTFTFNKHKFERTSSSSVYFTISTELLTRASQKKNDLVTFWFHVIHIFIWKNTDIFNK